MGSALVGNAVPMPLGLLASNVLHRPDVPSRIIPENDRVTSDIIFAYGPMREFTVREFHAGRLPLWQPANFLGAPFTSWPKYSPFELPYILWPTPRSLAWMHLMEVVWCGLGGWLFLRRCLAVSFWPAALASWCMPLTGYMAVWLGFPLTAPVASMPWLLTAIHLTVRHPWGLGPIGVAVSTAVVLLSGPPDIGGLVMLTSGLYAVWQLCESWFACGERKQVVIATVSLTAAWGLGFAISSPYWLPLVEYVRTGARMQARAAGMEERPPGGLAELARVVVPEAYGNTRPGSRLIRGGNLMESSAGAYAGLIAALFFAPLSFADRRRRSQVVFWSCMAMLSLAWQLNMPILVTILRLPGLNMLSFNRWVFVASFSVLVLAAVGLERCLSGPIPLRKWFVLPIALSLTVAVWCLQSSLSLPEPIGEAWSAAIRAGQKSRFNVDQVAAIQASFRNCYRMGLFFSMVVIWGWLHVLRGRALPVRTLGLLCMLLCGELLWFAQLESRSRLADASLYYPRVPALEKLSRLPAGRIQGFQCLLPNLNQTHGLRDIRGYDAVDPQLLMKLLDTVRDPSIVSPAYARTWNLVPKLELDASGQIAMPQVLNMLNVRYLISRKKMGWHFPLVIQQDDYWVYENTAALPRAFVPRNVRTVQDDDQVLESMTQADFDPRDVGFLHTAESLSSSEPCEGIAHLRSETPREVEFEIEMQTDGVVVVSDLWDPAWRATIDDQLVETHRANITLRGIPVQRGPHILKMTYAPESVSRAFQAAVAAIGILLVWAMINWRSRHYCRMTPVDDTSTPERSA